MELTRPLANEYLALWETCEPNPDFSDDIADSLSKIASSRSRYEAVSTKTGVPWYVIAVIHGLESGFDFNTHLHNGDSLDERTVHVPEGRPIAGNPPFTWEESAIDALAFDGALGLKTWNLPNLFWFLEGFNGWGYRLGSGKNTTPPFRSAYIYSASNHYQKGKYRSDGVFDPDLVSQQIGAMIILKTMNESGLANIAPLGSQAISPDAVGSVSAWQHLLNGCGYFPALTITGQMDDDTIAVTKRFQQDLGLPVRPNVDIDTWRAAIKHKKLTGWNPAVPAITSIVVNHANSDLLSVCSKLHAFYSRGSGYDDVKEEVLQWFGTTTNGCVAFASTALRLSGYGVPIENNDDGFNISTWTEAFSDYLIEKGWTKGDDPGSLKPGDIVFTDDGGNGDGIPMHVYVFSAWHDNSKQVAWVLDNQAYLHRRNIFAGGGGFNFSPFAYYLRF